MFFAWDMLFGVGGALSGVIGPLGATPAAALLVVVGGLALGAVRAPGGPSPEVRAWTFSMAGLAVIAALFAGIALWASAVLGLTAAAGLWAGAAGCGAGAVHCAGRARMAAQARQRVTRTRT
jgi:hypothetical protein